MATVLYWIVQADATATPTGAQIVAGQDGTGAAALASGSEAYTAAGDYSEASPITGLSAGTAYEQAWVAYDGSTYSSVVTATITTWFTSSGALSAQAATVNGTATHLTLHTSTGALAAQSATVAGTAVHPHIATGALTAQSGTVAGTADHSVPGVNDATGALSAQSAVVSGTAAHYLLHASTGALSAQAATVAGTAAHYTLHTSTGALEAGSATVSGTAVDETTYVPPVPQQSGGGKSRKPRKRRYQVEIDGEVHEVESLQEAEEVLAEAAQKATETAKLAIERAAKAKRRPVRKIVRDAEKALEVPAVSVPPSLQSYADQMIGQIRAEYQSALSAIEIAAHMARREREIEEDDEEVLMLL